MQQGKAGKFFYGYIVLGAIWIIYFFNVGTLLYGTSAINASMVRATGYDAATVGLAVSIATLMQGLTGPIVGSMIRKKGVKTPLLIGSVCLVAAGLLIAFVARNVTTFVLFYGVIAGTGMGFAGILTTQCTVNAWFEQKKALALAIAVSAGAIGGFILPQVCQAVADTNWKLGWIFISVTCTISILLTLFVMVNKPADIGEIPDGLDYHKKHGSPENQGVEGTVYKTSKVFRTKTVYMILINNALRGALYYATIGHVVLYLVGKGFPQVGAVFVISIMSISSLFGRFLSGFITGKRIDAKYVCFISNLFCTAAILFLTFGGSESLLYIGGAFMGIGIGLGYISMPVAIATCYGQVNFPAINGWISSINYIVNAIGPLVAGIMATMTGSYVIPFMVFGILCALGSVSALAITKPSEAQLI